MNALATTNTQIAHADASTLNALEARYIAFVQVAKESQRTYSECLSKFFKYLASIECNQPTRETILAYRAHLIATMSPASVAVNLASVRGFFKWLESERFYTNVAKDIKAPKIARTHKKGYLNVEQVKNLLSTIETTTEQGARDYAIVVLMVACGLRCVEISEALKEDLRYTSNGLCLFIRGKGNTEKATFVKLPAIAQDAINHYISVSCNKGNVLFSSTSNNSKGKAIPPKTLSQVIKQRFIKAGLDSSFLTAHSLRHTAITLALIAGENITEVQAFARHKNIQTTMIYNHAINYGKNTCSQSIADALAL